MSFVPRAACAGRTFLPLVLASSALCSSPLLSSPASAQTPLQIGSANTAVADPPVPRPATAPITVPLFRNVAFADFSSKPFSYTPPAGNPKRWAKIVLAADFSVSAGRQFDRTAQISVGHTNIFFGTTAEPSRTVSPSWHVERDVTDYAALLASAQPGQADLGNLVNSTYTGVIQGSASLLFYPLAKGQSAPVVPDVVLPLPAGGNGVGSAGSPMDVVSTTATFPTNTVRAYLDLITQSQGGDEFWYLSVPTDLASALQSSGGTAFREAEVSVDGTPAGVAPVFPWIYTGGIDPYLWRPIPGVQTLNFTPYRVDLTPFAGTLNDGQPHTVGVRIFNNNNYFQIAGVLKLYTDPVLRKVAGAVTENTLTDPSPVVQTNLQTSAGGEVTGPVSVTSRRSFVTAGYLLTSKGRVETKITQNVGFSSVQQFDVSSTTDIQKAKQLSVVDSATETRTPRTDTVDLAEFRYPLTVDYSYVANADGSASQTTSIQQTDQVSRFSSFNGFPTFFSFLSDTVTPTDTLVFSASGSYAPSNQHSAQTYFSADSTGRLYRRTITADGGVLTGVTDGLNGLTK
jgi:hypothetical protein